MPVDGGVVPDLYEGKVVATTEEAEALAEGLDHGAVLARLEALTAEFAGPWAAMGFSLGAFFAAQPAGRVSRGPDELVLFYGGRSPGDEVERLRQVELHVVPNDPYFTAEELTERVEGFRKVGSNRGCTPTRVRATGSPSEGPPGSMRRSLSRPAPASSII